MKGHITVGQIVGVVLVLLAVVAVAAGVRGALVGRSEPVTGQDGAMGQQIRGAKVDCSRLVTPENVGPEAFARHALGEKLANGEFVAGEYEGYLYCSHGQPHGEGFFFAERVDILYMFDAATGALALTRLEWGNPSPPAKPSPTPVPPPTPDPNAVTVCIGGDLPLVERGGENPGQLVIWDILGGNCSVSMGGSETCFACGEGARLLVPAAAVPEDEMPVWPDNGDTLCIDATTAAALQAAAGGEVVDIAAPRDCSFQLGGGGGMCWVCSGGAGEPAPEPTPSPEPTEAAGPAPACADYLTEAAVGAEEWARYEIANKVGTDWFARHWEEGSDVVVCYGHQRVDEADVRGTELYYLFDVDSRALLKKRIHWRHDLPEHLPELAVSKEEAEGMVKGEVRYSALGFLSLGSAEHTVTTPIFRDPCWFVSAQEDQDDTCPYMTVINAITGEVIGHWMQ